jgi:hypothetical protein
MEVSSLTTGVIDPVGFGLKMIGRSISVESLAVETGRFRSGFHGFLPGCLNGGRTAESVVW